MPHPQSHSKPTPHLPARSNEHAEQCAVVEWMRLNANKWPELEFAFAIPNGAKLPYRKNKYGQRYSPQAIKLLAEGMLPGVSDLMIPAARGGYHGFFLELKYGKNIATNDQTRFIEAVTRFGYYATVAWGYDEAIALIEKYMKGEIKAT